LKDEKTRFPFKRFWLPLFGFSVAVIIFYKTVDVLPQIFAAIGSFLGILTPLIIGIVFAFLLYKPVSKLEVFLAKRKNTLVNRRARGFSVLISYAVLLLAVAALLYFIIPAIGTSIGSLVKNIPEYYNSALGYVNNLAGEDGRLFGFDVSGIGKLLSVEKILSYFSFDRITKYAEGVFKATGAIVDVLLAFVISVYLLLGREHFIKVCGTLIRQILPAKRVDGLKNFANRSCNIFYNYIYAQLIDALVVAVLCTIAFSIAGVPYALLLAVLMGLCNIIPYFGAFIGGFTVVLVTLVSTGDVVKAIVAFALVLAAQQLDANIIQPRIMANSVGIRPLYVLIAIMVGGGIWGFFGILLAVPLMAIIRMLVLDFIEAKKTVQNKIEQSDNEIK
jgi:predicted PurR-regulated permease PerM